MICFPMIRDELCKILAGRTRVSAMPSSLSKTVLIIINIHPSIGIFVNVSVFPGSYLDALTGTRNMSIPFRMVWTKLAVKEVASDHSSHGILNIGTPNMKNRSIMDHLKNSQRDVVSSSTSLHQSYSRHTRRSP
jgi:hypothetical protein